MRALPDLHIDVKRRHVTDGALTHEVKISGTQLHDSLLFWFHMPATRLGALSQSGLALGADVDPVPVVTSGRSSL